MRLATSIVCAALMFSPIQAGASDAPPTSLPKAGNWVVSYDEDSCNLFAKFGAGKQAIAMRLSQTAPSDRFDVSLYGEMFKTTAAGQSLRIGFGPQFRMVKRDVLAGTLAKELPLIMFSSLRFDGWEVGDGTPPPAMTTAQEAAVTATEFRIRGKAYRLETGPLAKPMAEMRKCTADLVRHWGFDPEVQASLRQGPIPKGGPDWINSSDYPHHAAYTGHYGLVSYRLDVDETGKVAGCRVLFRTNPDDFADLTCQLLTKRARFDPALDAGGKPAKSFFMGRVRWTVKQPPAVRSLE